MITKFMIMNLKFVFLRNDSNLFIHPRKSKSGERIKI